MGSGQSNKDREADRRSDENQAIIAARGETFINEQGEVETFKEGDYTALTDFRNRQAKSRTTGFQVRNSVINQDLTSDFTGL